jgi:hypothetical protein
MDTLTPFGVWVVYSVMSFSAGIVIVRLPMVVKRWIILYSIWTLGHIYSSGKSGSHGVGIAQLITNPVSTEERSP